MTFPTSVKACDPIAYRAIRIAGRTSNAACDDALEILQNETEMMQMYTHNFSTMFKSIIEENKLLWLWNKNIQRQIPFLHHQEDNYMPPNNTTLHISYLIFKNSGGSESHALAKVYRKPDAFSPCLVEFSAASKSFLVPITKSILMTQGNSLAVRGKSEPTSNLLSSPRFDRESFYPVKRGIYNIYEVSACGLLHYSVENFSVGLKVKLTNGTHGELIHLPVRPYGYVYIPEALRNSQISLSVWKDGKTCDSIDFRVMEYSFASETCSLPPVLSHIRSENGVFENGRCYPYIIQRASILPPLNRSTFLNILRVNSIQGKLQEVLQDAKLVLYNEHTGKNHSISIRGDSFHFVIPESFALDEQTIRLYIYRDQQSPYPLDDLYFLVKSAVLSPQATVVSPSSMFERRTLPPITSPEPIRSRNPFETLLNPKSPEHDKSYENSDVLAVDGSNDDTNDSNDSSVSPMECDVDDYDSSPEYNGAVEELLLVSRYGSCDRFESSILNDTVVGKVVISLLIRRKRRGQWYTTNVQPKRIGKMRKCLFQMFDFSCFGTLVVESSNVECIKISQFGRSSSDGTSRVQFSLQDAKDSQIQFFIVPVGGAKAGSKITIRIEYPTMSLILHQWDMMVANHKYESSQEGISQSKINQEPFTYFLFSSEQDKNVVTSRTANESQVIDSLYLLRDFCEKRSK